MCGITGLLTRDPLAPADRAAVARMNEALAHRGPDGVGEHASAHVALAMRRLSIIDLDGGQQPLYSEDGRIALVANGEIYNHVELRVRLEASGHRFRTGSDCETIVHLYEEYGPDCVRHLRGMFAFALWDEPRQRFLLARDRMGEKPLYLYEQDGSVLFASEMKALLRSGLVPMELDPEAVDLYFHYQYVPEPRTPLRGVRKLDAAHTLVVDVDPWSVREQCYWRMEDAPPLEGDPARTIRAELETVSTLVVRSDVPVGVALSGGLDSSAVAALASAAYPGRMQAFSVGYVGRPESDEREDARGLARHLGLPFNEVELDTRAVVDAFPELNYWRDDPIADISGAGYHAVMTLASQHGVPVMLQGQGGDELFWGYPQLHLGVQETLVKAAAQGRSGLGRLLPYLSLHAPAALSPRAVARWVRDLGGLREGMDLYRTHRSTPPGRMRSFDLSTDYQAAAAGIAPLYGERMTEGRASYDPAALFTFDRPWPDVEVALTKLVCATYLRENGITQGDRLGMASSVEMRLPLVDYRLVETVIGLRKTYGDAALPPKTWLREAVRDALPAEVFDRPKRGFAPPTREWHDALFAAYGDSLCGGVLVTSGILSREGAEDLARGAYPDGLTSPLSFKALVLEQWCRQMSTLL